MRIVLNLPDEALASLPVPAFERERFVLLEIACSFYARGVLSLGIAAELAGVSRIDFGREIGARNIPRHYGDSNLAADVGYPGSK